MTYLHRIRINAARPLLEDELRTVQDVSLAVGCDDLAFFRRLFRRYTGMAPRAYRERFGPTASGRLAVEGRAPHR
ncbi:MAG: helix-turn-helix domain-containing protein [Dehalococcoidia bacterium]